MAETIPYKYYEYDVNGRKYVDTLASTNTPTGYKEIDFNTFQNAAKNQYEDAWYGAGKSFYDSLAANPVLKNALQPGTPSQYVINPTTGNQQLSSQFGAMEAEKAGIANGSLQQVPIGSGFGTVPTGSAASTLQQGLSSGAVSPTNPTQQFQASMTGNNVNAPGITPVAPTPSPQNSSAPTAPGSPVVPVSPQGTPQMQAMPPTQAVPQNLTAMENQYRTLLSPTQEENDAQSDLTSNQDKYNKMGEFNRNRQVAMRFISGEQDALNRQSEMSQQTLQQKLALAQAKRQSALDASRFSLERADRQAEIAKEDARYNSELLKQQQSEQKDYILSLAKGVTTPWFFSAGTGYKTDGTKAYSNSQEMLKDMGVNSFEEAKQKGLVSTTGSSQATNTDLYTSDYKNYLLSKQEGFKGTFEQWQTEDANRRRTVNNTIIAGDPYAAKEEARVKQIIDSNPGEWGKAADQINREFGVGAATKYDALLREAFTPKDDEDDYPF